MTKKIETIDEDGVQVTAAKLDEPLAPNSDPVFTPDSDKSRLPVEERLTVEQQFERQAPYAAAVVEARQALEAAEGHDDQETARAALLEAEERLRRV